MVTSAIFIALIGTFQFEAAVSAAIGYEPIKITVNENFNAQPGQVSKEIQSLEPVHQGANFYFKPRFQLPSSSHHIEALMSLIQQHHSCTKDATKVVFEKEKLMEILKPFLYPKEALSNIVMEEENNSEIVEPLSILITEEPKPATPDLLVIPEAPVLPPISFNGISPIVEKEIENEESVTLEESTGILNEPIIIEVEPKPATIELEVIPEGPVLPPFSSNDIRVIEEIKIEELHMPQPTELVNIEPKPITPELFVIPEAPELPALSFNGMPSIVEEAVKKEESAILEDSTDIFLTKPAITVGAITEPIIAYVEPKLSTSGLLVIPESSSLSFNSMLSFVEKEVQKEKSIILEESTVVSQEPTTIEVEPATPELLMIPEAPVLSPLSANDIRIVEKVKTEGPITLPMPEPIFVGIEPKPKTSDLVVIPEAPVLPPLSFSDIPTFVEKEMKKKESIILEESTGVSQKPTIIEIEPATPELLMIPEAPILPPFSTNDIQIGAEVKIKEPVSLPMIDPIVVDIEPKSVTPELLVIPEAPVLPELSFDGIPAFVKEEVKNEKSVILEGSTGVLQDPTIIEAKPATAEFVIIPEAPVLPSLSFKDIRSFVEEEIKNKESIMLEQSTGQSQEPIIIEIEPKPATPELEIISELPVLPPLSFNGFLDVVEEEVKKEESPILEESQEPTMIEIEPKPATSELIIMPEAPVLPPLSANDIRIVEEVKIEEPLILPVPESIVVDIEPKPATPEIFTIPEAPMLPPLSFTSLPFAVEKEVKKEESVILEELTGISQEPTIIEVEPKPTTSELVVIPEAPVLPPLSANDIRIVEEVKIKEPIILPVPESIIVDIDPKPTTQDFFTIPEAPMLPPLSFISFPSAVEEVKKEKSVIVEELTGISQEPTIIEVEPKHTTSELVVIPEAPVLPPMSEMPVVEEVKSNESIIFEEFTDSIPEISARPSLESFVETESAESFALENNIFPVAAEEIKIEIPILLEESLQVFPSIAGISSGPTFQEPEITNPYVLEEVSQPNLDRVATVKETLPPTIIRKPSNNQGVFSYAPFLSHLSNRVPKTKKRIFPKPASLERFLLKKHPFRLPVTPFPKLSWNDMKSPILENKNQFLYPTSYAHDVVEKRIAPNMAFKKNDSPKRVKIYVRSNVPKGPSYL